jgi:hypothetical protein
MARGLRHASQHAPCRCFTLVGNFSFQSGTVPRAVLEGVLGGAKTTLRTFVDSLLGTHPARTPEEKGHEWDEQEKDERIEGPPEHDTEEKAPENADDGGRSPGLHDTISTAWRDKCPKIGIHSS